MTAREEGVSSRRVGVECSDTRPRQNSTVTTKEGPCGTRVCWSPRSRDRRRSVIVRKTADGELLSKVENRQRCASRSCSATASERSISTAVTLVTR